MSVCFAVGCSTSRTSFRSYTISINPIVTKRLDMICNIRIFANRANIRRITFSHTSRLGYCNYIAMSVYFAVGCATSRASLRIYAISVNPIVTESIGIIGNVSILASRTNISCITILCASGFSYCRYIAMSV